MEVLCTRLKQYSLTANFDNNGKHTSTTIRTGRRVTAVFRDISNFPLQWLLIIGITTIWILVVYLIPFGNCPAGYLGPGNYFDRIESLRFFKSNCQGFDKSLVLVESFIRIVA